MTTPQPKTVKLSISLTADGQLGFSSAGSSPDTTAHDQCRALMLGIYVLCRQTIGGSPDTEVIQDLKDWADEVMS
ncbi:hypothetical protein [Brachybacterium massiliense]|uniref:hypothetical protein n=1 Tax=Brachybacterium massiliense TaxID=1755098 RepID=UPI000B3BB260|nr:hypothetical protein [Brachybacterium massiliense]